MRHRQLEKFQIDSVGGSYHSVHPCRLRPLLQALGRVVGRDTSATSRLSPERFSGL